MAKSSLFKLVLSLTGMIVSSLTQAQTISLITTITNPTPATTDTFGYSIAAVGDRILVGAIYDDVGAVDAGAAYLFNTNGTLAKSFFNPTPAFDEEFGLPVAAVGNDRALIGAPFDLTGGSDPGAAYLFSTNGTLLVTFTNPIPSSNTRFGASLATFSNGPLVIGAYRQLSGSGAAYLFETNGTLLSTLTNPSPTGSDLFGFAMATLGTDRVIISAIGESSASGIAYLVNTNGTLLSTFTNPTPANNDAFGYSVASVGTERVLISSPNDSADAFRSGIAYLFNTNGALITTITNPAPGTNDQFGFAVAATSDRLLIAAATDTIAGIRSGAVYLHSVNGTLLATITNPAPADFDYFGSAIAPMTDDRIIVGASSDDAGATDSGSAYLFRVLPTLRVQLTATNTVAVSWPSLFSNWTLQQNTNGFGTVIWNNISASIQDNGTYRTYVTAPTGNSAFYRLIGP
jgi:hypothetical protein